MILTHTADDTLDVAAIVARLSEMGELSALNYFWLMIREGATPITMLTWLSQVVLTRPVDWDKAVIRQIHERGSGRSCVGRDQCFGCCNTTARLYLHHVIEIQNGGSNAMRNLVPLCFACHKTLHPWLTVEPTPKRGEGFIQLRDVIHAMLERGKMKNRK